MIIFFITTQENLCNKIAERLMQQYNHIVRVFTNPRECYKAAISIGVSKIDLVACDYMIYDVEEINIFELMAVHNCIVPFFFYNSPFSVCKDRVSFWYDKMNRHIKYYSPDYVLPDIKAGLRNVDEIISAPDISPYIKLLAPTPQFPGQELNSFRLRNKINFSRFKVLSYLYDHKNQDVSEQDLCLNLWNEVSPKRIKILYSYISELRKICRQDDILKMAISRSEKQSYCLTVAS